MVAWYDELPSTQDLAHRLAGEGAPHGTVVAARVQTAGRGTRARSWISDPGGLWMSVVCRPEAGAGIECLGIRIGLAIAEVLESRLPGDRGRPGPRVLVKWPNDLMLSQGKLGGVLTEARWQGDRLGWVVVGVGINVHNPLPSIPDGPVASLAQAGFSEPAALLAGPVAARIAELTRVAGPLDESELQAFAVRDWLRGREVLLPHGGVAAGLGATGRLRIETPDGRVTELDDSTALRLA